MMALDLAHDGNLAVLGPLTDLALRVWRVAHVEALRVQIVLQKEATENAARAGRGLESFK